MGNKKKTSEGKQILMAGEVWCNQALSRNSLQSDIAAKQV